jgi:small conductance mechanosensitive channel
MNYTLSSQTNATLWLTIAAFHVSAVAGLSQDPAADQTSDQILSAPVGSAEDPTIDVGRLKVLLRPLSREELQTEAEAWLGLVRAKIREVGETEFRIKDLSEDDADDNLTKQLVTLRTEETALVERTRIVLDDLKAKGGDVEVSEQFIAAVSDITETTDAASFWAALSAEMTNWAQREDGGKLWTKRLLLAFIVLIVFWAISRFAGRAVSRTLARHPKASLLLENFARRTTGGVVLVVGILMALATLGVPIGPLMAALGGGGFIVGFALQETLGNFASGLLIMVYRPFDLNDYVNVAGAEGTVREMSLVATTLVTVDNKLLVIPNKTAWGQTITNFTGNDVRRVDLVFGIGYEDDIEQALNVLKETARQHPLVLEDPAVTVHVDQLADSSVNLFCRPWVKTDDYWSVHWDLTRQVKERFDAEGISIPFPQRDVHVYPDMKQTAP